MTGHTPWSKIKHKRDKGTRPLPHLHEGRGPRCLACGEARSMHPGGKSHQSSRCMSTSPVHGYVCSMWDGHDGEHVSLDGVRWGFGGFAENREQTPAQKRDVEQVAAMHRHTRPLVDPELGVPSSELEKEFAPTLSEEIFADDDKDGQYLYPYQDEAAQLLEDFIDSHVNAINMRPSQLGGLLYVHEINDCRHCEARKALKTLNDIINNQARTFREYKRRFEASEEALIRHGDVVAKQRQEIAVLTHDLRVAKYHLEATRSNLRACKVELHDNKQHQLGLMCAEQEEKLNKIKRVVRDDLPMDAQWLASEIKDILEGIDG